MVTSSKAPGWFHQKFVIEPKIVLLAAQQASQSGDELLEQGMIEKLADQGNGGLVSQSTILTKFEFRLLSYKKGKGYGWLL